MWQHNFHRERKGNRLDLNGKLELHHHKLGLLSRVLRVLTHGRLGSRLRDRVTVQVEMSKNWVTWYVGCLEL